jgi:hypothetical protein
MAFADLNIPGVAGSVSTEYGFWSGYKFRVGGERVKPHGFPRNRLSLPGTEGPIEAKVKGGLFRAHPALVVGGTEFSTGAPTPRVQQALALLPLAGLLLIQGALGFLVTFGGIVINMGIVRSERSDRAKIGLMVATLIAVVVIDLVIAVALLSAFGT